MTSRHGDRFLAEAQRGKAVKTRQVKAARIAGFYRFLEIRYQGEIHALTGHVVASPIDAVNRPTSGGEFAVRIPPSVAELAGFFARWRDGLDEARKWRIAARNYAMARLTGEVGLRAAELCGLCLDDLHFDHGPLGKIHVRLGKGARGSGPRERLVPMLGDARPLLVWWVGEVRGEFGDDFDRPRAPLFPSERGGPADDDAFRLGAGAGGHAVSARLGAHPEPACAAPRLRVAAVWRGPGVGRGPAASWASLVDHHDALRACLRRDTRGGVRRRGGAGRRAVHGAMRR